MKERLICCLTSVLASVLIVLAIAWWLRPPQVVSFDLKGTTDQFLVQSAKLDLDEEQRRVLLARYNQKLSRVLEQHAREHHQVIVVRAAAASGIPDITPQLRRELAGAMKESQ